MRYYFYALLGDEPFLGRQSLFVAMFKCSFEVANGSLKLNSSSKHARRGDIRCPPRSHGLCVDEGLFFPVALGIPHQHADPPHLVGWLRARREWPCRR
jgi:hypothetical protein